MKYIRYYRSMIADMLLFEPICNHLLSAVAQKSILVEDPVAGLKVGECFFHGHVELGVTRQQYRTAIDKLRLLGLIDAKATNKGTIISLANSDVYGIIEEVQPTKSHQAAIKKPAKKRFVPPTKIEVSEYMRGKGGNKRDAQAFWNYYGSNGWKVGSNKMANWKLAASGWLDRNNNGTDKGTTAKDLLIGGDW